MSEQQSPEKKIVWLASYPKSGNTWFRAFLTALLNEEELDINDMKTDGIFSSRELFDSCTDLDSIDFYYEEIKVLQPEVFKFLNLVSQKEHLFIKIHDAYSFNPAGDPIVPTEATRCAIYFIRNPLDIAGSLANHNGSTIDQAIQILNDPTYILGPRYNYNVGSQLAQLTYGWSGHVKSWTEEPPFPVLVLRYEDMLANTFDTFRKAIKFMGLDVSDENVREAIRATLFEQLQQKERQSGFREKLSVDRVFFRKGKSGNWQNELNEQQIESIVCNHKFIMKKFGYPE